MQKNSQQSKAILEEISCMKKCISMLSSTVLLFILHVHVPHLADWSKRSTISHEAWC